MSTTSVYQGPQITSIQAGMGGLVWDNPYQFINYTLQVDVSGGSSLTDNAGVLLQQGAALNVTGVTGTMVNNSTIVVNHSNLSVQGMLEQPVGMINVINGGHVTLDTGEDGGGIAISSGMLEFARRPDFMQGCETASGNCSGWLAFTGATGALKFDGEVGRMSVRYDAGLNDLIVKTAANGTLGIFHFAASGTPYSAKEFSVKGDTVMYHHITSGYG